MSLTKVEYTYTGQTTFPLTFPLGILSREFVSVRVNNATDGVGEPLLHTDVTWVSDAELSIGGLTTGDRIVISLNVPKETLITSFEQGSPVTHINLDNQARQSMIATHTLSDNFDDLFNDFETLSINVEAEQVATSQKQTALELSVTQRLSAQEATVDAALVSHNQEITEQLSEQAATQETVLNAFSSDITYQLDTQDIAVAVQLQATGQAVEDLAALTAEDRNSIKLAAITLRNNVTNEVTRRELADVSLDNKITVLGETLQTTDETLVTVSDRLTTVETTLNTQLIIGSPDVQVIGTGEDVSTQVLNSALNSPNATYAIPVETDGKVLTARVNAVAAGDITVYVYSRVGDDATALRSVVLPVTVGYGEYDVDLEIGAGEYVGFNGEGVIGRTTSSNFFFLWVKGNINEPDFTDSSSTSTYKPAIDFIIGTVEPAYRIADEVLRQDVLAAIEGAVTGSSTVDDTVLDDTDIGNTVAPLVGGHVPLEYLPDMTETITVQQTSVTEVIVTDGVPLGTWPLTQAEQDAAVAAMNIGEFYDVSEDGTTTALGSVVFYSVGDKIRRALDGTVFLAPIGVANINVARKIVDISPDPVTVGPGQDFATYEDAVRHLKNYSFMGLVEQDVIIHGSGDDDSYEWTKADAQATPFDIGPNLTIRGAQRFKLGQSRLVMADVPRFLRVLDNDGNAVGWVAPGEDTDAALALQRAWMTQEFNNRVGTRIVTTSNSGFLEITGGLGGVYDVGIQNGRAAATQGINLGRRGRDQYARGSVGWNGLWVDNYSLWASTAVNGNLHFGTDNVYTGCGSVCHLQYQGSVYSDFPDNGISNLVIGGGHAIDGKGDCGSVYVPHWNVVGCTNSPLSLTNGVGYINSTGSVFRDNLRGVSLQGIQHGDFHDTRFADTRDTASLTLNNSQNIDASDAMAYGSATSFDVDLRPNSSIAGFIDPTAETVGGTVPPLTRVRLRADLPVHRYIGAGVIT